MNRTVVEPPPVVHPLYKHFSSDKSEFGFSSEPTSPQHSKELSFVKKHKRHKSNTPTHRAKSFVLNRNTYPSLKYINNNSFYVTELDAESGVCDTVCVPSIGAHGVRQENSKISETNDCHKSSQFNQEDVQFFVKISKSHVQCRNEKVHRRIHPKQTENNPHNEDYCIKRQLILEKDCSSSKKDKLHTSDVQDHSYKINFHEEMQNDTNLKEFENTGINVKDNQIFVKSSDCDLERGENLSLICDPALDGNETIKSTSEYLIHNQSTRSIGIQVSPCPQYRLRFLPICGCGSDENEWEFCQCCFILQLVGRWAFSQCGLAILLFLWALLGAAAFHSTEGPHEVQQAKDLRLAQKELVINLATELRHVVLVADAGTVSATSLPIEPVWFQTIEKAFSMHEQKMLKAVSSGYGEGGGGDGSIWSYAGCLLFAVSLLTTLGFGAPVPRTTLGRIAAVIFSAVGIPLHLLLVFNIGMLVAVKMQNLSKNWQNGTSLGEAILLCCCSNFPNSQTQAVAFQHENTGITRHLSADVKEYYNAHFSPPRWLKLFPACAIAAYYLTGFLVFGVGRSRPFSDCLLFPLDFTATGGVGLISSFVRTTYAIYLEGAVILAAISVSIWQVSASKGLTNLGLKLGLLTNS